MRALPAATMAGILDDAANTQGSSVAGLSVLGGTEMLVEFQARPVAAVLAVGLPSVRRSLAKRAAAAGVELVTIIDPDALVHGSAELGPGCLVMAGSIVSTGARLGVGCLLNFGAMAGHDCILGDYCVLDPGSRIGGKAVLGTGVEAGTNSVVMPGLCVGDVSKIGAGSVPLVDVPPGSTAFGVPARILKKGKQP